MPLVAPSRSGILGGLALALIVLLQACGGGTSGNSDDPPPETVTPTLVGRAVDDAYDPSAGQEVRVKGSAGLDRLVYAAPTVGYEASLNQISGPFLLTNSATDGGSLYSVAVSAGTANLTPFTTLLVAELLGSDPAEYFRTGDGKGNGGFTGVTQAQIDDAQSRVRRLLLRDYGFEVPTGLGDFVTTPFEPKPGDPTYDAIVALAGALAALGTDYRAVAGGILAEAARCRTESVAVTSGGLTERFCPAAKRNDIDEADPTVNNLAFRNQRGDALAVRVRGDDVLAARYVLLEGPSFECSGAACSGIVLGVPAGNGARQVTLSNVVLTGVGGSATLDGSLLSAVPGLVLDCPTLGNRFVLSFPDRPAEGYCAGPSDGLGFDAVGSSRASGSTRRIYSFGGSNGDVIGPTLEVVTQGDSVYSMLLYSTDPDTGLQVPLYQCRDGNCPGAALGPVTVDLSFGTPIELRAITLQGAVLAAVLPDGSLSTTESVTLDAEIDSIYFAPDPAAPPFGPVVCAPGAPTVAAALSEDGQTTAVCVPEDTQGFQLAGSFLDEFGNPGYFISNLVTDGVGSFTTGNGINVFVADGTVQRVTFDALNGVSYRCDGSACAGVTVSAPNGAGETSIGFADTLLREVGTAGLPVDRTATLSGFFVAPPSP